MSERKNISIQLVVNGKNKRQQQHKYDVMFLLNARIAYRIQNWYCFRCVNAHKTTAMFFRWEKDMSFLIEMFLEQKQYLWIHCTGMLNTFIFLALKNTNFIYEWIASVRRTKKSGHVYETKIHSAILIVYTTIMIWKLWHTHSTELFRQSQDEKTFPFSYNSTFFMEINKKVTIFPKC